MTIETFMRQKTFTEDVAYYWPVKLKKPHADVATADSSRPTTDWELLSPLTTKKDLWGPVSKYPILIFQTFLVNVPQTITKEGKNPW